MRIFSLIFVLALLLALLSGCQHPPASVSHPTKLAGLIADADHIVAAFRPPPWDHPSTFPPPERYRNFSLTISGDEARKIVRAVSTAEQSGLTDSIFALDLQFYREAQFLAEIHVQGSHFLFESEEFADGRVLEHLGEDVYKRMTPPNER